MAQEFVKKVKIPPTLIIGLGGTGCDIVSRVDKLANKQQREFIRCVFFDTDANELRERKEEAPHTFTVQTSKRMTVGQALRTDREACEHSFPKSSQLLKKPLTEGAGQVRAVSKLAFDACVREGRLKPLHDAINELQYLDGDTLEQSMRVVIVTTLVGGTGSGILLPVAMYLRNYLENICQTKPLVRGVCVLPDVFFHGTNKTESEKSNLRANAYAALRELDAFMQKSENPDAFTKFSLLMPTPGTLDEYDSYAENPMDFCFLYDGLNMDGNSLQNFESYKRHIAECIYASSVSILNKRLNSSEDNTILSRCGEGGRNRYCGIGSSKIVYPFEHIRDYIAMGWMSQAMTEDWLRYDKEFEKLLLHRQSSQKKGVMLPVVDKHTHYCERIDADQKENPFAGAIYAQCHLLDSDGVSYGSPKAEAYYRKLLNFIAAAVEEDVGYDEGTIDEIESGLSSLRINLEEHDNGTIKDNFTSLAYALKKYYSKTKKRAESKAGIIADSLFSTDNFSTDHDYRIEKWLFDGKAFIHPNAVRYLLYRMEKIFSDTYDRMMSSGEITSVVPGEDGTYETKSSYATLEDDIKTFFDGKRYPRIEIHKNDGTNTGKGPVTIEEYVESWDLKELIDFDGGMKKPAWESAVRRVINDCSKQFNNIHEYYKAYLEITIIQKALNYIGKICANYEYFFKQLETEIARLPLRMQRIETSFNNNIGDPRMYICASQKCIQGLSEKCPNTVDPITLTEDFRTALFNAIYKVSDLDNAEKNTSAIKAFVEKNILEFWSGQVVAQYGKKVDMDIIDALCTQAEIEEGKYDDDEKIYYIKAKYEEAMKLASPFIDRPIGEEPYEIYAYAMATEVSETDDTQKARIIDTVFSEHNADPLMDKYQMLFLNALYNLRISKLPKFAPADTLWVDPHDEGSYFKAYWKRINDVMPDDISTKVLTPHLDRRWHYAGIMPDLSEKSEEMCLRDAHRALFIAIAYGNVKYYRDRYRFIVNGQYLDDDIVVSDEKCNRFCELYEAMLMSRPLVRNQLAHYAKAVDRENNSPAFCKIDYTFTDLYKALSVAGVDLGSGIKIDKVSFFELPLLYKVTAGGVRRSDAECITMVTNIIDFIEEYLSVFYNDELVRTSYFVQWMTEQFELMCNNLTQIYKGRLLADPFKEPLVERIKEVLEARIENCRMMCLSEDDSVEKFFAKVAELMPIQ